MYVLHRGGKYGLFFALSIVGFPSPGNFRFLPYVQIASDSPLRVKKLPQLSLQVKSACIADRGARVSAELCVQRRRQSDVKLMSENRGW